MDRYFDDYVFSTDVGLRKPHPKMFKIALSNLGVDASEAMYVGNSLAQDIKGAKGVASGGAEVLGLLPPGRRVVPDHTVGTLAEIEGCSSRIRTFGDLPGGRINSVVPINFDEKAHLQYRLYLTNNRKLASSGHFLQPRRCTTFCWRRPSAFMRQREKAEQI